jgi:hypothetical protein
MFSDWVSFLAYPNLFGIKGFVVIVVVVYEIGNTHSLTKLACDAPFLSSGIPPQSMFSSETRAQWTLLKWIIYLQSSLGINHLI